MRKIISFICAVSLGLGCLYGPFLAPLCSPGESGPGSSRGGGSIRDVCLMGLDHGPHNTSLFQLSLAGY